MTTVRALTSGVTGMLANQLAMDVSANNVANVNTPGFKGSRTTFGSNLIQTLFSGSALVIAWVVKTHARLVWVCKRPRLKWICARGDSKYRS